MQPTAEQWQYVLTDKKNQLIFSDIWLDTGSDSLPVTTPIALFLGGQSGSGKSGLAQYHLKQFSDRGGVVLINSDALREYHPTFAHLQRTDAEQASFLVNPDTVTWQQKLIAASILAKRNLLFDGTLGGNSALILQTIKRLHSQGYSIQISVLAVPAEQSRLGIYRRYEDQVALKGSGRWVSMVNHDRLYREITDTLQLLEGEPIVDQIQLYARPKGNQPPVQLYTNRRINGRWQQTPTALVTLYNYRNQWLTDSEREAHERATLGVFHKMTIRGADQQLIDAFQAAVKLPEVLIRLATADDIKRYFDWSNDPATRLQSFNSAPIQWKQHEAWFGRKIANSDALLLVWEYVDSEPFGQARFEKQTNGEVIISISIDKLSRGMGLASQLIVDGCDVCQTVWGNVPIIAYIKPDNTASVRAFERAGFVEQHSGKPDRLRLVKH